MQTRCLIIWLLWIAPGVLAQPAEVVLLRHGEKPDDPQALHLSARGEQRAKALVGFFTHNPEVTEHGAPVALFAVRPTKHGHGQRAEETLVPLAKALHVHIHTPYLSEDFAQLARGILHKPDYRGKTVVICWVHEYLPQFAAALGVAPEPPKWRNHVYDRAYVIRYPQGKADLTVIRQHLLPGDD